MLLSTSLRALSRRMLCTNAMSASSTTAAAATPTPASSSSSPRVKTGILMMNMGGPSVPEETGTFLHRLFNDPDIIDLGGGTFQKMLGTFIAKRRTPKVNRC